METNEHSNNITQAPPRVRLIGGGIFFITGFLCPLLIPWVISSDMPSWLKSAISGLLAIGIPELFMIIAVAILGKPGYQYLKRSLLNLLKRYGPPEKVSKTRYSIGLVMFVVPLAASWAIPYFGSKFNFYTDNYLLINITLDIILLLSIFVLGGEFWDKLRGLFIREATINIPVKKEK